MKYAISASAFAATLIAGAAVAADLPSRKASLAYTPPAAFTWTGAYAGLDVGGGWLGSNGGVSGGGQIGYNRQLTPLFVVGVETDFQGTSLGGGNGGGGFGRDNRGVDWFGTVRGRVGVTPLDPHVLIYGTGGFAYGETGRGVREGWTAGGGVEWAFLPNWSTKIEYLYTDLSKGDGGGWAPPRHGAKFHTIRVGVNYHFDLFAPTAYFAH